MTTYSDEVNIYNTSAIADGIAAAGETANTYITEVSSDNGIVVAPAGKGTVNGSITGATTGWHLGDVLEYIKQGISRFWIGLKNSGDSTPTVRIGKKYVNGASDNESHMELDYHSMKMVDMEGNAYLYVSDLRDRTGTYEVTEELEVQEPLYVTLTYSAVDTVSVYDSNSVLVDPAYYTINGMRLSFSSSSGVASGDTVTVMYITDDGSLKAFTLGTRASGSVIGPYSYALGYNVAATGNRSHAEGSVTTASGYASHAEGNRTTASGVYSHVEGYGTTASGHFGSHAEGYGTTASGYASHAEGRGSTASGHFGSHAEGSVTTASGYASHAEGYETTASGDYGSHAEGNRTTASGRHSHAQNIYTKAAKAAQTALGTYNEEDTATTTTHPSGDVGYGKYAVIVGNGTIDSERSNAFAVDWTGHTYHEGLRKPHEWFYLNSTGEATMTATNTYVKMPITGTGLTSRPTGAFEYDSTNKAVTANVSGWFMVSVQVGFKTATSGDLHDVAIGRIRNGTSSIVIGPECARMGGTYDRVVLAPTNTYIEEGDKYYVSVKNESSGRGVAHTIRWMVSPLLG